MDRSPTTPLAEGHCTPCEGLTGPLPRAEIDARMAQVPLWTLADDAGRIGRRRSFRDFRAAMAFLNRVADLAESEGHHPDLHLVDYRRVRIDLRTHAVAGLSDNDFILAARIDALADADEP